MEPSALIADIGIGLISGYVGTKVMEPVSMQLYEWEREEARQQEDAVRPGPPYEIAAKKTAEVVGIDLSEPQVKTAGLAFHYGPDMSWGPVYTLLRRMTNLPPLTAGLLAGAAMSLLIDEGLTPAPGFSAPNRDFPPVTHLRGLIAHLTFGLGVAATAELLYWLDSTGGKERYERPGTAKGKNTDGAKRRKVEHGTDTTPPRGDRYGERSGRHDVIAPRMLRVSRARPCAYKRRADH